MTGASVLMLREGLEGGLVVALLLAYLARLGRRKEARWVWVGTLSAVAVSLVAGIAAFNLLGGLHGRAHMITQGSVAFVAAGVLTWMILGMARRAFTTRNRLEQRVDAALRLGPIGLGGIAFLAVFREGIESALFLTAPAKVSHFLGGMAGLSVAIGLSVLAYRVSRKVNLQALSRTTAVLLTLFAAGLVATGVHQFQDASLIGTIDARVWDSRQIGILNPATSPFAQLLQGLFGWSPAPSFEMFVLYVAYLIPVGAVLGEKRRKVFLDVGAHLGETLKPSLDPRYGFHNIVAFEPVSSCCDVLARYRDPRIEICAFGLSSQTSRRQIYNPGMLGATIYPEGREGAPYEIALFKRASDWFAENLGVTDRVFLKLNCEGSECEILDDLIDSGEIQKVESVLVDFDVRKFPSLVHREKETRRKMDEVGNTKFYLKEQVKGASHTASIYKWLLAAGAVEDFRPRPLWRLRYVWIPIATNVITRRSRGILRRILPEPTYVRLRALVRKIVFFYPERR